MIELNYHQTHKSSDEKDKIEQIKLGQVLSHPKTLNLLMQHLGREFSMECLLSLIGMYIIHAQYLIKFLFEFLLNKFLANISEKTKSKSKIVVKEFDILCDFGQEFVWISETLVVN